MAKNDINSQMFFALRVSEQSRVPFLFMSAPGMGKSTTVSLFAEYAGYKVEILRGNSTSESEVMGYDVVDPDPSAMSTRHLRPSWFGNVLKNEQNGQKTLLFVDEITTCPEHVQAALLHLIFERKVGNENIPDSTFIVSAGNYSQSLGSSFGLLPPLMNRFCIFNIIPTRDDVPDFILHHRNAAMGAVVSYKDQVFEKFRLLDKKAVEQPDESVLAKVYEIFEIAINDAFQTLAVPNKDSKTASEAKIDIKVSDVQSIYSDVDNDDPLCGFVTMRTLSYASEVTVASWLRFGKTGVQSTNFRKVLEGLVGLGFVRSKSGGSITTNHVADDFYTRIVNSLKEIDRAVQHSATLDSVVEFYKNFFANKKNSKKSTILDKSEAGLLADKLKDVIKDNTIAPIAKPLDISVFKAVFDYVKNSMKSTAQFNLADPTATLSVSDLAKAVTEWNIYADLFEIYGKFLEDSSRQYDKTDLAVLTEFKKTVRQDSRRISNAIKINTDGVDENSKSLIPKLHTDYCIA